MLQSIIDLGAYSNGLASIAYVVGIIGFVPAVIGFIRKTLQELRENEEKIFNEIAAEYFRINELLLTYPQLGASWFQQGPTRNLTEEELAQRTIVFDMITALFEMTYLAYQGASGKQRRRQWFGWVEFIRDYCRKADYRKWWRETTSEGAAKFGAQYDQSFEEFMRHLLAEKI